MTARSRADEAVALADFSDRAAAVRLAGRLVAEGFGADIVEADDARPLLPEHLPPVGPTVVVRRGDYADAVVVTRLFDEVDQGRSRVAPGPLTFWHGAAHRQLIGYALIAAWVIALGLLMIAAIPR